MRAREESLLLRLVPPLKITFLLPNINLRGGTRTVLEYADRLVQQGDEVTVVFPTRLKRLPLLLNEVEYLWRAPHKLLFGRWWFSTSARVLAVPGLDARYIPRGDVVVATAWQTARWVAGYPADRGEKYYFVQDVETYTHARDAAATYALALRRIVTSPWIREQLLARFGATVHALVPFGPDLDLYRPGDAAPRSGPLTIGTLYDKSRRKGFDLAARVVERLREQGVDFGFHVLGTDRRAPGVPRFASLHARIPPAETPAFYRSCDVWLCASRSEGFYLPGLEAMACGCALVTTQIGGTVYYAIPGETASVCAPGDEDALLAALGAVARDATLRQRLAAAGAAYVRRYDLAAAARHFRDALHGQSVFIEPPTGLQALHCD